LLKPEEAVPSVEKALSLCPEISVVGVAGPGDALASDHALIALRLVHERFPALLKCISTNGLRLAERADEVLAAGIRSVTVTVNAVDSDILASICPRVVWEKRLLKGREAASVLIEQQMLGIQKLSASGAVVKVNTVLVPGVNDGHIGDIVSAAAAAGAHVGNVIPLIPNGKFKDSPAPSCDELEAARKTAESKLAVNRTCRQCRADACGVPGSGVDFARKVFGDDIVNGDSFSHG
jgi:nitrogen fixation protein NifB